MTFFPDRQAMRDLHTKYYEYTRECGLEPENRYMHIEHGKVGKFYANINLALEKELPGPEEGESLEEYARHAIHYRDSLQKAIEWKRESNPELAASMEQLIANLQQGYEKERTVRLDGTEKEKF